MSGIVCPDHNYDMLKSVAVAVFLCAGVMVSYTSAFAADAVAADVEPSKFAASAVAKTGESAGPEAGKKSIKTANPKKPRKKQSEPVFATVNGMPITVREYEALFALVKQQRYYHGEVPEGQVKALRKEVTDELVDRLLFVGEAKRRGIKPDPKVIEQVVAEYDARYGSDPKWVEERERFLPELELQVGRRSMIEQLEVAIREVPRPTPAEVHAYYKKKSELFTEPEKPRLSVILLRVDPSSSRDVWTKAQEEAKGIYDRIKNGADFAEEARLHSAHESAANGGDMGYLHGGMLSEGLDDKLKKLKIGEVSEPIRLLEGISLYRIEDRIPAKEQEFSIVEKRAEELLIRDRTEQARVDIMRRLRTSAKIKYFDTSASGGAGKFPNNK